MESTLVILVPEAEGLVRSFRERYHPSAKAGMPAHITLLYPFKSPNEIDGLVIDTLSHCFSSFQPFKFSLMTIQQFPGDTLYLVADGVDGDCGDPMRRHRGGDVKAEILVLGASVAENCHWPAGGGLGAGRQVDIEVNLVRPSHGRSPGASSDRGDELSRVYLVIGRVVPFDFLPQPVTHARAVPTRGRNSPAASTS